MRTCQLLPILLVPAWAHAQEPAGLPAQLTASVETETPARVLRLETLVTSARQRQPQLLAAKAATEAAAGRADQAGTIWLPQVNGTVQYLRTTGNFAPRPGTLVPTNASVSLNPEFNAYSISLSASQLVWDFGQTSERILAAKAGESAQTANQRSAEVQIILNVRRAFFQTAVQKALVGVAKETLENQQRHLRQVEGFVRVGTRPEIDLAQIRTNVANAQVQYINAQNNVETAKALLLQAAGMPLEGTTDIAEEDMPPVEGEEQKLPVLLEKARQERPELLTLAKQKEQQERLVAAIQNALWPTISLTGNVSGVGVTLDGITPNWNVGALLNWAIFQGGLNQAQIREAQANVLTVESQRAGLQLQIQSDVEQARLGVQAAKAVLGAAQEALANAREQLRLAEGRYAHGLGNIIELNDTQLAVTNAAVQLVTSRFSLAIARAQLLAALGRF